MDVIVGFWNIVSFMSEMMTEYSLAFRPTSFLFSSLSPRDNIYPKKKEHGGAEDYTAFVFIYCGVNKLLQTCVGQH